MTVLLLAACAVCLSLVVPGSALSAAKMAASPGGAVALLAQAIR